VVLLPHGKIALGKLSQALMHGARVIAIRGSFDAALGELASRTSRVYLHIDLDSIDVSQAQANSYAASGGPSLERLSQSVRLVCQRFSVAAAAITAYDPAFDEDERTLAAARRMARDIADGVRAQREELGG